MPILTHIRSIEWWKLTRWFTKGWWQYLLEPKCKDVSWLTAIWCRVRGHPAGVVWFTLSDRLEPDMSCKDCGDDLG